MNWTPDPEAMEEFRATLRKDGERQAIIESLGGEQLLGLYRGMLRHRLHEIMLKRWVKQGVISKAWLATGEEAVTAGCVHALNRETFEDGRPTDFVGPLIRNAGAWHEMGLPISGIFKAYLGTADSPMRGRDLHIGDVHGGVIPPISHLGELVPVCAGIALAFKLRRQPRVAMTWIGDGATKTGVFHEGFNFAAAQGVPLVLVIQNNQVALGTLLRQHQRGNFADWPKAYGVEGAVFDGNNVLDTYAAAKIAVDKARRGDGPIMLIAETFRMGGHATHDEQEGRKLFPPEVFAHWGKRDPIGMYETYLTESKIDLSGEGLKGKKLAERNAQVLQEVEQQVSAEVDAAAQDALYSRKHNMPKPEDALGGVYSGEHDEVTPPKVPWKTTRVVSNR
jgi:TPP-dependent pyruvate/acetoin dehydrogenase alpha subunit